MNSNQWILKNWGAILLVVAVLIGAYLMFGPDRNAVDRADQPQSFLTGDGTTGIVNDGTSLGTSLPPAAVQQPAPTGGSQPAKAIEWCVLLDGASHIPDLFGEGIDNGNGGTNWHSDGNQDPKGPHGVFNENGKMVFFAKKSYLDQNGSSPMSAQLKSNITGWDNPLTVMTLRNVAGEPAWVYIK